MTLKEILLKYHHSTVRTALPVAETEIYDWARKRHKGYWHDGWWFIVFTGITFLSGFCYRWFFDIRTWKAVWSGLKTLLGG